MINQNEGAILFNRDASGKFELPADGKFKLVPMGTFPHAESGSLQVIDEKAIGEMVTRFNRQASSANFTGLIVDYDHFSYDPQKSSQAAGWITAVEARKDGLWGAVRWTATGEAALKNGEYRGRSPTWLPQDCESLGGNKIRPLRLDSVGLTNKPNLTGMPPLSNRQAHRGEEKQRNTMESINRSLGLAPEASEAATLAAVTELQNRASTAEGALKPLQNRVNELEATNKTLEEAQVESDLEAFKNRITPESAPSWKALLIANRKSALEALKGVTVKPGEAPGAIHNRETAGTPASVDGDAKAEAANVNARKIANRAHEISAREGVNYATAWNRAKGEFKSV